MIQFGLRLHDAEKLPIEQVLPLVRQKGFSCVHLALSKSLKKVPNTPSALTPGYAAYLRRLFAKNELDIAVLGNYLNLAHPHGGHRDRCPQRGVQVLPGVPQRCRPCHLYQKLQAGCALRRAIRRDYCH